MLLSSDAVIESYLGAASEPADQPVEAIPSGL